QVAEFVASLVFPRLLSTGESIRPLKDFSGRDQESTTKPGHSAQGRLKESEEAGLSKQPRPYGQDAAFRRQDPNSMNRVKRSLRHLRTNPRVGIVFSAVGLLILGIVFGTQRIRGKQERQPTAFERELARLN